MTRTEVAALALRLAALYLVMAALIQVSDLAIFYVVWMNNEAASLLGAAAPGLVRAILGVGIFLAAPRVARAMTDGDAPLRIEDHFVIGAIAIRLAGILLWDAALALIPSIQAPPFLSDASDLVIPLGVMLVVAALGTWLFLSAPALGAKLFGSRAGRGDSPSVPCLASVAFSAVGLLIVANSLPALATAIGECIEMTRAGWNYRWGDLLAAGGRVTLGTFVFLGAGVVARVWHKLSTAGLQHRSDAT